MIKELGEIFTLFDVPVVVVIVFTNIFVLSITTSSPIFVVGIGNTGLVKWLEVDGKSCDVQY
jgi:hypothetical protein